MKEALLGLAALVLRPGRVKNRIMRALGCDVDDSVRIGHIVLWRIDQVRAGKGTTIGSFNVIRNLRQFELEDSVIIGSWNWFSGAPEHYSAADPNAGRVSIGDHAALTSRHYVDATGGVFVGRYTTVAGHRSMVLTHGIDLTKSRQVSQPVTIGDFSLIGAGVKLVPGANVPSRCLVGMGAVVSRGLSDELKLYAGSPARALKDLDADSRYFWRTDGVVKVHVAHD